MITVDNRGGSLGLDGAKRRLNDLRSCGADAELGRLDFGDYGFAGNGPDGTTVMVGVELKRTQDLLLSLRGKRLVGHQLPGLNGMYDFPWLVTEGIWRSGAGGAFEHYQGTWQGATIGTRPLSMSTIQAWILSAITPYPKVKYWHTGRAAETAGFISTLHRWWTEKAYEDHRTSQCVYIPPPALAQMSEPSDFLRMLVAGVEGLGWTKGREIETAVGGKFGRLRGMTAKELQTIEGVGPVLANRILETLQ
jgi:ERCC4-type nuclease